jgi:hypothetical protein
MITDLPTPKIVALIGVLALLVLVFVHRGFAGISVQVGS